MVRVAIVGAGQISRQHIACLKEIPGVEIASVCDLSRSVAEATADRFRIGRWDTDFSAMLRDTSPDVVHVTTPPQSHFTLARAALENGAHVILEKPATATHADTIELLDIAEMRGRLLIENYNYVFNSQVQKLLTHMHDGSLGRLVHVEVRMCLPIFSEGSVFADRNLPHSLSTMKGGAIADFLPHLASLAHAFVGRHRKVATVWRKPAPDSVEHDEFRALLEAERGTATLAFSANAQPDVFSLTVEGTRMRANANLFEPRLIVEEVLPGPKPLLAMRNGLREARHARRGAYGSLWRKLGGGPGAYEGLWELLRRTYRSLDEHKAPPISPDTVREVNDLVDALVNEENRL